MTRERVSSTVDGSLLADARRLRSGLNDASLLDEALSALLASDRSTEIGASYSAYDDQPIDEKDA